ncbi:MAG: hypothetical protein C0594_05060 [Marinilabiliales bacterium]|nr:MAG: hypothetical protein C0594_05060 [Marinilabiliales bacterium]
MKPSLRIIFIVLLLAVNGVLCAQNGTAFIANYDPEEYHDQGQIWDIVQDNDGLMYFAGGNVLQFDGVNWRRIEITGQRTIRSLAHDTTDNTVYIGGIGEFGFLKPDSTGKLTYHSISANLNSADQEFFDIWKTEVGNDGIYFSANKKLFRYNPNDQSIKVWKGENEFFLLFNVNGEIYTGIRREGIAKITGDSLKLILGGNYFSRELTWFMLPYGDNKILMGNQVGGLVIIDPNDTTLAQEVKKEPYFNKYQIARTDSFLFENQLYGGILLHDGNYALATIRSGIIIVNPTGEIIDHIYEDNGLQSQTVHYLFQDRQNALWAGLTYGISRIEINSPITQWNKTSGIDGSIYNAVRHKGKLYVSSNLGLFMFEKDRFLPVKNLTGPDAIQVFSLEVIKNEDNEIFLASSTSGIFEINGLIANMVIPVTTYSILQTQSNPMEILIADNSTLLKYLYNGSWVLKDTCGVCTGFPFGFSTSKNKDVWFINDDKPACLTADNKIIYPDSSIFNSDIVFLGTAQYNNKTLLLSDSCIWEPVDFNNYQCIDNLVPSYLQQNILQFQHYDTNKYWIISQNNNQNRIYAIEKKNNTLIVDSMRYKRLPRFDEFRNDGDSILWIISSKALYQVEMKKNILFYKNEKALIRSAIINNDSIIFKGSVFYNNDSIKKLSEGHELPYSYNNIIFEYALPSFDARSKNQYRFKLLSNGKEDEWSSWTTETKKEYTNLSEGHYTFKIQAKNAYDIISQTNEFNFKIHPPWYRNFGMYLIYAMVLILIVWGLIRWFTIRLKKKNQLLEKIVRERTQEIWEQKEEIKQQAEELQTINDELQFKNQEINQRNAEIAAQRDNLELLSSGLEQRNEEISAQRDELLSQRNAIAEQKELLENINSNITDSIAYAHRIQSSALPNIEILSEHFPNNFVFFRPRDVVSGDFYWFDHIEGQTVITAADCTGHGVPGALMSILGMSLLKEIVVREYITHPGVILRRMRKGIIEALNQKKGSADKDGMDMALISINKEENTLQFAGANNPLYIIRNKAQIKNPDELNIRAEKDNFVIIEYKPDKMPVGIYERMNKFNTVDIQLESNDMLYMFSDGYVDQFGGHNGKKLKYKKFRNILLSMAPLPCNDQEAILEKELQNWKKDSEQVDDIVLIGIRI